MRHEVRRREAGNGSRCASRPTTARLPAQSTGSLLAVVALTAVATTGVAADVVGAQSPGPSVGAWPWIGSVAEDRLRDAQLVDTVGTAGFLLRSAGADFARRTPGVAGASVTLIAPSVRVTTNSALPFTLNDGAQWAGRGTSALVRAGVAARVGRLRVVLAPEAVYAGNAAFDFRPSGRAARSPFALAVVLGSCDARPAVALRRSRAAARPARTVERLAPRSGRSPSAPRPRTPSGGPADGAR